MNRIVRLAQGGIVVSLLAAMVAPAQPAAAQLPAARSIVDRYIEAIGGRQAVLAQTSFKVIGKFAVPASGLVGDLEVYQSNNQTFARIMLPGIGEMLRGYDGTTGWSVNAIEGPRLLEGMELAQMREESRRNAALRDTSLVTSLETVERTTMNGQECWKIKVVWKSGRETQDCYSVENHLLVANVGKTTTPMGEIDYVTNYHDYKQFGAIKVATRVVQTALGQEQVVTTESIEFGPVDAAKFALPEAIKALVK